MENTNQNLFNIEYSIGEIKEDLKDIFVHNPDFNPALWGAMGIGKSEMVAQIADELGWKFFDIRIAQFDPIELKGIPTKTDDGLGTKWLIPDLWPKEEDGDCILFLDEFSNAAPAVQNVVLQLLCERKLHDYEVPKGCRIIVAGNRAADNAFVSKLGGPTANRLMHFNVCSKFSDVEKYWKTLGKGEDEMPFRPEIISFLEIHNDLLHDTSSFENSDQIQAFPTPRTWDKLSQMMNSMEKAGKLTTKRDFERRSAALVGQGAALQFATFRKHWIEVDPKSILSGERKFSPTNDDVSTMHAAASSVPTYLANNYGKGKKSKLDEATVKNFLEFALSLRKEFQLVCFKNCDFNHNKELRKAIRLYDKDVYAGLANDIRDLLYGEDD